MDPGKEKSKLTVGTASAGAESSAKVCGSNTRQQAKTRKKRARETELGPKIAKDMRARLCQKRGLRARLSGSNALAGERGVGVQVADGDRQRIGRVRRFGNFGK